MSVHRHIRVNVMTTYRSLFARTPTTKTNMTEGNVPIESKLSEEGSSKSSMTSRQAEDSEKHWIALIAMSTPLGRTRIVHQIFFAVA